MFADAEALLRDGACVVTAIDIPIGLTSARARRCDIEARRLLGPRKSSAAPARCTLEVDSHAAAMCCLGERVAVEIDVPDLFRDQRPRQDFAGSPGEQR